MSVGCCGPGLYDSREFLYEPTHTSNKFYFNRGNSSCCFSSLFSTSQDCLLSCIKNFKCDSEFSSPVYDSNLYGISSCNCCNCHYECNCGYNCGYNGRSCGCCTNFGGYDGPCYFSAIHNSEIPFSFGSNDLNNRSMSGPYVSNFNYAYCQFLPINSIPQIDRSKNFHNDISVTEMKKRECNRYQPPNNHYQPFKPKCFSFKFEKANEENGGKRNSKSGSKSPNDVPLTYDEEDKRKSRSSPLEFFLNFQLHDQLLSNDFFQFFDRKQTDKKVVKPSKNDKKEKKAEKKEQKQDGRKGSKDKKTKKKAENKKKPPKKK
ncbi:hypothetical protein HELRODRAFT_178102 [Helobdella robusta]|uniref:Uncharacterized protein n=1 Tax=Helobdella robusta TaxID=6412 RepID=T1FCR0_HELRO|nr:hypothetical protein HELRODRAFT_178102 [Helobdella robusta]ESN97317.1 hypothetical protein HELRODRAFT_178102 [Helobdella robusta]